MNKDTLALVYSAFIFVGFFVAASFDVLNHFIVKALLFFGLISLAIILIVIFFKNHKNKNHPK